MFKTTNSKKEALTSQLAFVDLALTALNEDIAAVEIGTQVDKDIWEHKKDLLNLRKKIIKAIISLVK